MGLDTTHGCWSGPCSSFNDWRRAVARCAGIDLERMQGYATTETKAAVKRYLDQGAQPDFIHDYAELMGRLQIPWDGVSDPLKHLLHHSDCDGSIALEHCAPIADRLQKILPLMLDGDGYLRDRTRQFIDGLRTAVDAGEDVEFH